MVDVVEVTGDVTRGRKKASGLGMGHRKRQTTQIAPPQVIFYMRHMFILMNATPTLNRIRNLQ